MAADLHRIACQHHAHFISMGINPGALQGEDLTQSVPFSNVTLIDHLQRFLRAKPQCSVTRVLPSACLSHWLASRRHTFICPDIRNHLTQAHGIGRHPRADELPPGFWPNRALVWTLQPRSPGLELRSGAYLAVHLNLDSDWLLYMANFELYMQRKNSNNAVQTRAVQHSIA